MVVVEGAAAKLSFVEAEVAIETAIVGIDAASIHVAVAASVAVAMIPEEEAAVVGCSFFVAVVAAALVVAVVAAAVKTSCLAGIPGLATDLTRREVLQKCCYCCSEFHCARCLCVLSEEAPAYYCAGSAASWWFPENYGGDFGPTLLTSC